MRCVVQRVSEAYVTVDGRETGRIEKGLCALIGVETGDTEKDAAYLAGKIAKLRIFEDENEKMNRSVLDVGGKVLAVSQFTLLGDARGQNRPPPLAPMSRKDIPPLSAIRAQMASRMPQKEKG